MGIDTRSLTSYVGVVGGCVLVYTGSVVCYFPGVIVRIQVMVTLDLDLYEGLVIEMGI